MQVNLNSLGGYYSDGAKRVAEKLIDAKMVHLVGTDAHSMKHVRYMQKAIASRYFAKLMQLPLINPQL